ncbi:uncharacterized protein F5891DRAFT_1227204 [Suillus fuscotomentosus]|uniref:Uncharacterized protein n=1 Tax=Suillus fuscotomentosus TaxID=1912939 RepID=A0AAD4E8P2_9AGAM|nr:uncharacterized protein F5891DRAFT_1227204 [Suillus fuscotomentosus]KAG1900469.1 hypothetical protein F5891DRAFT_1227204 [Suillus fuscotomentosus]
MYDDILRRVYKAASSINSMVKSITSARQRTRAQTAAFLLGTCPDLPSVGASEITRMRAVRHFYERMTQTPSLEELTVQQPCQVQLDKIEFRIPLHTLDRNQSTTYVDRSHSESDCRIDILDSIKATMDVSKTYQHLGWRLSTARRLDPPHRLLTSHDLDSAFKAARTEQGSGRKTKQVFIEILNTARKEKQIRQQAGTSPAGEYKKELATVTSKLRCSDHQLGEDTFCWVDASHPDTPHYPLCTRDLQEWAKYLYETGVPDFVTLPRTPHFNEVRKTRKERTPLSLQRVSTEIISPVIHNHIHLSPTTDEMTSGNSGMLARERGEARMALQPLKRTFALYMESDEESDDDEPPQHIEDVLGTVHSHYPAMNFPQYVEKLMDHGIFYLPTAAHFSVGFYEDKVGMSEGSAYTFQSCVSKFHMKAELAKERRKAKGKKKARAHDGDENEENTPVSNGSQSSI